MSDELIIIHVLFVSACVYCSIYWGRKQGAKLILQMLLNDNIISERDLERYVPDEEKS